MDLSVVVPTLDSRDQLAGCLSALSTHAPEVDVIVVNGPSTDGTSGFVRSEPVVDRLVEVAERNLNSARNAGINAASTDRIAFLGQDSEIGGSWLPTVADALADGLGVVTGPVGHDGTEPVVEGPERRSISRRRVTYFDGGNVAFLSSVLDAVDGFDEHLETGGARDLAHRLAGLDHDIQWEAEMTVTRTVGDDVAARTANGERDALGLKYESLSYRLVKNYGLRPGIVYRLARHMVGDGYSALRGVLAGDRSASEWLTDGRSVGQNLVSGARAGLSARRDDPSTRRNPNGVSTRRDRAVACYDC